MRQEMAVLTLEQQLAATQAKILELTTSNVSEKPHITLESIQEMIDREVSKKLGELSTTIVPDEIKPKRLSPLECINMLFTPEECEWLCNPSVLRGVDNFIIDDYIHTDEGKLTLQQFFKSYRNYYESKS